MKFAPDKKFAVFEGILEENLGQRFYSTNRPGEPEDELVKLIDGTVAYRILGYADTPEEALAIITPQVRHRQLVEKWTELARMNGVDLSDLLKL